MRMAGKDGDITLVIAMIFLSKTPALYALLGVRQRID